MRFSASVHPWWILSLPALAARFEGANSMSRITTDRRRTGDFRDGVKALPAGVDGRVVATGDATSHNFLAESERSARRTTCRPPTARVSLAAQTSPAQAHSDSRLSGADRRV